MSDTFSFLLVKSFLPHHELHYEYIPNMIFSSWRKVNLLSFKTWLPDNDVSRDTEKSIDRWQSELPGDWPPEWGQPENVLVIGQDIVVTSQEGIVMPQGCYKSPTKTEAALRREMALSHSSSCYSSNSLPTSLSLPMASHLPTPPAMHLATPRPVSHCEYGLATQGHIPISHMGAGHWKSEHRGFSATWAPHLWVQNTAQHRKAESTSWRCTEHPTTLEPSNPAQHRDHEWLNIHLTRCAKCVQWLQTPGREGVLWNK